MNKTNILLLSLLLVSTIDAAQLRQQSAPTPKSDKLISPMQLQGDQHRAMLLESIFADLQEPAQEKMDLEQEDKALLDILRAAIDLDEEIQHNKTQEQANHQNQANNNEVKQSRFSLPLLTAYNLARVKAGTTDAQITSKSDKSLPWFVPVKRWSLWRNEGMLKSSPNKIEIDVQPSIERVGYLNITINARGLLDRLDKQSRPAHDKFATLLRQITQKNNDNNNANKKDKLIIGQVKNLNNAWYGSSATIQLHCNSQLIAYLMKDKIRQKAETLQAQEDELLQFIAQQPEESGRWSKYIQNAQDGFRWIMGCDEPVYDHDISWSQDEARRDREDAEWKTAH